jgi:hypothetical protein
MGPRKLPVVSRTTSRQAPVPPQNTQIFMGKFGTVWPQIWLAPVGKADWKKSLKMNGKPPQC